MSPQQPYADPLTPNVASIARATADLLERYGWCQGSFVNSKGEHCIVGAIQQIGFTSYGGTWFASEHHARRLVRDLAAWLDLHGDPPISLFGWNDAPGRTADEVIVTLQKFADEINPQE